MKLKKITPYSKSPEMKLVLLEVELSNSNIYKVSVEKERGVWKMGGTFGEFPNTKNRYNDFDENDEHGFFVRRNFQINRDRKFIYDNFTFILNAIGHELKELEKI